MKYLGTLIYLFFGFAVAAQQHHISGKVTDEQSEPLPLTHILFTAPNDSSFTVITDKNGKFILSVYSAGLYRIHVSREGFDTSVDSIKVVAANTNMPPIILIHSLHMLDEVKVVQKVIAMTQKDDTLEFSSAAFKVNDDADAADLLRKMPTMDINGKTITSQGENIVKVLVDGVPFFSSDPYASLKNLPAFIIDKVQVYNESSDQEKFTGFKEGQTTKTINIITKPDKRNGFFGNVVVGAGSDNSDDSKYGVNAAINKFASDQRITVTAQSNNINSQNFTDVNSIGGGIATTNAFGINFSDKVGTKTEFSGSYLFNNVNAQVVSNQRKTYLLPADSGQVYNEQDLSANNNFNQQINLRLTYTFDTMNSITWQSGMSIQAGNNNNMANGYTDQDSIPINKTINTNASKTNGIGFQNMLLYRHRFHKKGNTFSVQVNTNDNSNHNNGLHNAQDIYYSGSLLSDTINQQNISKRNALATTGNATYTHYAGENGLLKAEYNISYLPAHSEVNVNNYYNPTESYSQLDTLLSSTFYTNTITQKSGGSYLFHKDAYNISAGANYQFTTLEDNQQFPLTSFPDRHFESILPQASLHYKFSKTKYAQLTYTTNTQVPSVNQLQSVINNTDPLHLSQGNPNLKQVYQHNLSLRYNALDSATSNSFSISLNGNLMQHFIAQNDIIAQNDTTVFGYIFLPKGSQLSLPENIEGYEGINSYIGYNMAIRPIKCHLNININSGINHVPSLINNQVNYQSNKTAGVGLSLSSNINENIDFLLSSNTNFVFNTNSLSSALNTNYYTENVHASLNLVLGKVYLVNSSFQYQANYGLSAGYNQNNALWNISIGRKIFKNKQGQIKINVFDILNNNKNISQSVNQFYIQDTYTNMQQRYFLASFLYNIRNFKSNVEDKK